MLMMLWDRSTRSVLRFCASRQAGVCSIVPACSREWNRAKPSIHAGCRGVFLSLFHCSIKKLYIRWGKIYLNTEKTCCHVLRKERISASCIFSGTMEHETWHAVCIYMISLLFFFVPRRNKWPFFGTNPRFSEQTAIPGHLITLLSLPLVLFSPSRPQYTQCTALFCTSSTTTCFASPQQLWAWQTSWLVV